MNDKLINTEKLQIEIDVLQEVLDFDFVTDNKASIPFSKEIISVRKRIEDRILSLKQEVEESVTYEN